MTVTTSRPPQLPVCTPVRETRSRGVCELSPSHRRPQYFSPRHNDYPLTPHESGPTPQPTKALTKSERQKALYLSCVKEIYTKYNPQKVGQEAEIVSQWSGREDLLFEALAMKYEIPQAEMEHIRSSFQLTTDRTWNLRVGEELPSTNHLVGYMSNLTLAKGSPITVVVPTNQSSEEATEERHGVFLRIVEAGLCHVSLYPDGTEVTVPSTAVKIPKVERH